MLQPTRNTAGGILARLRGPQSEPTCSGRLDTLPLPSPPANPADVQNRRDLDTLTDTLGYLRNLKDAATDPEHRGRYTSQAKRTAVGANLFGSAGYVASTLPSRESRYFKKFIEETDPEVRQKILDIRS